MVVHEYGHYKVAVLCGVRVLKFSLGFGKPLVAWQLRPFRWVKVDNALNSRLGLAAPDPQKTVFLISAIPLGGYVQMLDEREGSVTADQAQFAFNQKSLKARAAVVAAGPIANLALAILLYACIQWAGQLQASAVIGKPLRGSTAEQADLRSGDRILAIKVIDSDSQSKPILTYKDFVAELIAAKAHFIATAPLVEDVSSPNSRASLPQFVELSVKRGGREQSPVVVMSEQGSEQPVLDTTISVDEISNLSANLTLKLDLSAWRVSEHFNSSPLERVQALKELGLTGPKRTPLVNSVLDAGVAKKAGILPGDEVLKVNGLNVLDAQELVELIHQSAGERDSSPGDGPAPGLRWEIKRRLGAGETQLSLQINPRVVFEDGKSIGRVDAIIGGSQELVFKRLGFLDGFAFASQLTLDQALSSLVSFKSMVLGQLSWHELSGPLTLAEYAGKTAQGGWISFVSFVAFVSVSVGVLNLLPIPVLDGGQLMYYLWELISGSAPSEVWSARLMRFGLATVILMMCAAMFNDVLRVFG